MELVRLVTLFNLHPERDLHPSWLPPEWPVRHRQLQQYGPAGKAVLADLLRNRAGMVPSEFSFDSRMRRLALLDGSSLRRLAAYCGLCAHKPLFKVRGVSSQLRRVARRLDEDAVEFVVDRVPQLSELRMEAGGLQERPLSTGRVVLNRGYRLLMAAVAPEGDATLRRVQRKLPRRVASLSIPALKPRQAAQLSEVMLLCIVPERLPQWDWLF
ncbi:MAG TPA: SctK family type III secretion system sorting platform protein [Ramlibacter sp.]|nr:SctK family type III secretion system sorting platform protein [Ramlibacter sp.]